MARRLDYNVVRDALAKEGYVLLEPVYKNAHQRLLCRCPHGHETTVQWCSWSNGARCAHCHGKVKLTYEYVRQKFSESECELLENEYFNSKTPMRFRCKCGRESKIAWADFQHARNKYGKYKGRRWCKECGYERCRGANSGRWNPDREHVKQVKLLERKAHDALKSTLGSLGIKKRSRTFVLLGYGYGELKARLESHSNWADLRNGDWSLDHIFPIKAFVDHQITDIRLINSLDNLQPMSLHDNFVKNDTYDKTAFIEWLKEHGVAI